MAEIVVLNRWRSENARQPQIRIGEPKEAGQILLFTGVRYERFGDVRDMRTENQIARAD